MTIDLGLRRGAFWLTSVLGVALILCGDWNPGLADEAMRVQIGFDRSLKVGRWTPIEVEASAADAHACEVLVTDPDGLRVAHPLVRTAPSDGRASPRWVGVTRSGRLDGDVEVRVLSGDAKLLERRRFLATRSSDPPSSDGLPSGESTFSPLKQSVAVWLEIGTKHELLRSGATLHAIRFEQWPALGEIPWALDGVDGIWVSSRTVLNDTARQELERWLRRGGHLVVVIGEDREEYSRSSWFGLLKDLVELRGRIRTNDFSGVESFTVHGRKIGASRAQVTTLAPKQGKVLVSSLEGPLAVRASLGVGLVTVLGVDPEAAPLLRWDGRSAFVKRLVQQVVEQAGLKSALHTSLSQSGITDLASQWRAAAIHMPEVARPTLWGVLGLLLAYAAVIGPLDYVLVHKLWKRPHWTWGTLPLLVVLTSVGSVWLARAANGDSFKLTQLDVLDIDVERQEVVARSWGTAYSTQNALWRIDASPAVLNPHQPDRTLTWLGFPENASGGLYRDGGFDVGQAVARSAPDRSSLNGVPIAQWASKSLTAEAQWVSTTPLVESRLSSTAPDELTGSIVHHLPFELHDWIVVFEKWVYRPHPRFGETATIWWPDQPWTPQDERNYGRELRGFLTRTTATKQQSKKGVVSEDVLVEQERYNPLNLDPADILQMMTLHEAAGGKAYTGLDHHSLKSFDLSPLLTLDRAVVIARISEPTTTWRFNGEARSPTRHHSFVRFVLPVQRVGDASGFRALPKFEPHQPRSDKLAPETNPPSVNETKAP